MFVATLDRTFIAPNNIVQNEAEFVIYIIHELWTINTLLLYKHLVCVSFLPHSHHELEVVLLMKRTTLKETNVKWTIVRSVCWLLMKLPWRWRHVVLMGIQLILPPQSNNEVWCLSYQCALKLTPQSHQQDGQLHYSDQCGTCKAYGPTHYCPHDKFSKF